MAVSGLYLPIDTLHNVQSTCFLVEENGNVKYLQLQTLKVEANTPMVAAS